MSANKNAKVQSQPTGAHHLVHSLAIIHYYFVTWYDFKYTDLSAVVPPDGLHWFVSKLKFLTLQTLLIQALFFTVCFINDVVGDNNPPIKGKKLPFIRKFRDMLLSCLAFPLSMFVGLTFWGLYFIDRELVLPKAIDAYFPTWLNHCMHTNIMIFILAEMFTSCRQYPKRKTGLQVLSVFMITYLVWIHVIHSYTGMWVYPVLDVLNLPLRIVFFAVLLGLATGLYIVGEKLNYAIWKSKLPVQVGKRE